jgi:hypothetical protein
MNVDPAGLASAAQRISAALAQLPSGDELHPALAQEPVAKGAAARLTTAGLTPAALITAQAAGLAATAEALARKAPRLLTKLLTPQRHRACPA